VSGGIAGRGRPGKKGPAGPTGPTGPQGPAAFTLAIGKVSAVPYGQEPAVTNVGTVQDQVWNLSLVTGATGVLTGPAPPTGSDGTSLGQLYFCTTNQVYYGLIELNENDNKWRPLMTQSTAIREYTFDVIGRSKLPQDYSDPEATPQNAGHVHVIMDDVEKHVTAKFLIRMDCPINRGARFYVGRSEHEKLIADLASHGINTLEFPLHITKNGVTDKTTVNFLNEPFWGPSFSLADIGFTKDGTGSDPGVRFYFERGCVESISNEAGAPAATAFGNAPRSAGYDDVVQPFAQLDHDETYPQVLRAWAVVVMPYA